MMELDQVKEWIIPLTSGFALISGSVAAWLSLREYRLKLRAEARLEKSGEAESDVRLLTLFTELMNIANGRSGYVTSDSAVKWFLEGAEREQLDRGRLEQLNQQIEDLAILRLPVGSAAQDSAVASIVTLAEKHPVLREVAYQAIHSLSWPLTTSVVHKYAKRMEVLFPGKSAALSDAGMEVEHKAMDLGAARTIVEVAEQIRKQLQDSVELTDAVLSGGSTTQKLQIHPRGLDRGAVQRIVGQVAFELKEERIRAAQLRTGG